MKKKGSYSGFLILIAIITILSGIVTFVMVTMKKQPDSEVLTLNQEGEQNQAVEEVQDTMESSDHINRIFDDVNNIYLQNINLPSNLAEVDGKDKSYIIANFKGVKKVSVPLEEMIEDVISLDKYSYQINILNKNTKINFYKDSSYILLEVKNSAQEAYSVSREEMDKIIGIIERTYIDKQLSKLLDPHPEKVYFNAEDENSSYILNNKEIKELISKIKINSIENNSEYIDVPAQYPNYSIKFNKDDENYILHLINDKILIVETPMMYIYSTYDEELWSYVKEKMPMQEDISEDNFEYLFKSDKVIVNDIEGNYNLQNDTYFNIVIPRWIQRTDYKKVNDIDLSQEDLRFNLKFLIDDQWEEVLIYDNYMVYNENTYFAKNIYEAIRSVLMMP